MSLERPTSALSKLRLAFGSHQAVLAIALISIFFAGCIGNVQRANIRIRALTPATVDTGIQGFVEQNSQGGKFAPPIVAPSSQVGKTTIGGNFRKTQSTSVSFKVSGGLKYGY